MKAALLLLVLFAAPSWAGKRLVMEVTIEGVKHRTATLIEPTRFRTNVDGLTSMIFLTDGGRSRMVSLRSGGNEYTEIDQGLFAELQAVLDNALAKLPAEMRDKMKEQMGSTPAVAALAGAPKYVASGERVIKGFPCKVFVQTQGEQRLREMCLATAADLGISVADAGVFDLVRKFSEDLIKGMAQLSLPMPMEMFDQLLGSVRDIPEGHAVQIIEYKDGRVVSEDLIRSIEDAVFKDEDFSTGAAVKKQIGPQAQRP